MAHETPGTPTFYVYIVVIIGLVLFAGLMSGLTLGLMSLGLVDLEVLIKSGTPADKKHAEKILPVVKNQHLLLCTLLIGNALAMEALPIFLDALLEAWGAVLISVTLILMFGEILPQAVCSRHGLAVGAAMAPVVRLLLVVFFPVSYPISKLLDAILGKDHAPLFRRAELKTLVNLHGNEAGKGGELTHDETTIIAGALELTEKTASQAMTAIESVFSLDVTAKLDLETMNIIMAKGHSRVPVYIGEPTNIVGLLLVKNLLTLRPEDETPVRSCTIRKIPRIVEEAPLYDILNEFQKGHSHMAVVVKYKKEKANLTQQGPDLKLDRKSGHQKHSKWINESKPLKSRSSYLLDAAPEIPERKYIHDGILDEQNSLKRGEGESGAVCSDHGSSLPTCLSTSYSAQLNASTTVLGLDEEAFGSRHRSKKWEHTRASNVLEIGEESLPNFSDDGEVVGIITMEDLIEELLQEEILDETDEYIDIHNKIKVNLLPPGGRSPASPRADSTSPLSTSIQSNSPRTSISHSLPTMLLLNSVIQPQPNQTSQEL
ncbi:hypothetical protein BDL97_15G047500 [Sphagnum fallax]|nr:hypothetical protein BDL97_15G047500 [Sphagnum fallax]